MLTSLDVSAAVTFIAALARRHSDKNDVETAAQDVRPLLWSAGVSRTILQRGRRILWRVTPDTPRLKSRGGEEVSEAASQNPANQNSDRFCSERLTIPPCLTPDAKRR